MVGIIGGSGFYKFGKDFELRSLDTPFGKVPYELSYVKNTRVIFIPRHGKEHSIPPHKINYRANVFAAHELNVDFLISTNAVGLLHKNYDIGDFCVPDQIIDFTHDRKSTFFDDLNFPVTTRSDNQFSEVVHTDVSQPYDSKIRHQLIRAGQQLGELIINRGTMVVTQGPRFETPAEIEAYRKLGGDYVGMTSAPEVFLAKELEIPYASLGIITNYAAGIQSSVSSNEVFEIFSKRIERVRELLTTLISKAG